MLISPRWDELHARRWEWADTAFTEFREQLDPTLREHFPVGRRELSIVLYGPSQSGKSTLLLRLLGIHDEEAFAAVQRVLRGGRGVGNSATCTPTRYRWSSSSQGWEFAAEGEAPITTDGSTLQTTLAGIRAQVERGTYRGGGRPVEIGIPHRYRGAPDSPLWPDVLDLPGTNPKNPAEREHALRIAERHIATAHLVVLVTQSHKLPALRPQVLETQMPPLAMWPVAPHRFRVVLTHAISNSSVQRLVGRHGLSVDSLRQHHLDELSGVLGRTTAAALDPASLFPVEYGDSWSALQRNFPLIHAEAAPVVSEVVHELASSLTGLDGEQMRLLAALRARSILAVATHLQMEKLSETEDRLEIDRDRQRSAHVRALNRLREGERTLNRHDEELFDALRSAQLGAALTVDAKPHADATRPTDNTTARTFNFYCRTEVVKRTLEAWSAWANHQSTTALSGVDALTFLNAELQRFAEDTFDEIVDCCLKCDRRWYYIPHWFEPSPEHCAQRHEERIPKASAVVTTKLRAKATEVLAQPTAAIQVDRAAAKTELARRTIGVRLAHERVTNLEEKCAAHAQSVGTAAQQHRLALANADALEHRLTGHWAARTRQLLDQLEATDDPDLQILLTLGILLAHRTRDALTLHDYADTTIANGEVNV